MENVRQRNPNCPLMAAVIHRVVKGAHPAIDDSANIFR